MASSGFDEGILRGSIHLRIGPLFSMVRTILSLFFDFVILSENYNFGGLDTWLKTAQSLNNAEIDKACAAIRRDYSAIQNSIIFREYTNGPVEGKNTKTKFIKRTMFGRSHFDTLRTKILYTC